MATNPPGKILCVLCTVLPGGLTIQISVEFVTNTKIYLAQNESKELLEFRFEVSSQTWTKPED